MLGRATRKKDFYVKENKGDLHPDSAGVPPMNASLVGGSLPETF